MLPHSPSSFWSTSFKGLGWCLFCGWRAGWEWSFPQRRWQRRRSWWCCAGWLAAGSTLGPGLQEDCSQDLGTVWGTETTHVQRSDIHLASGAGTLEKLQCLNDYKTNARRKFRYLKIYKTSVGMLKCFIRSSRNQNCSAVHCITENLIQATVDRHVMQLHIFSLSTVKKPDA